MRVMSSSFAVEGRRNNTSGEVHKAKLVKHGTTTKLIKIATLALASSENIDSHECGVLAS